uniref:Uncharacterized protein n=1 Tax=Schizaphis graminum TaxID=13262 RepID=A0A2S2PEQ8_SCHGA
MPCRLTIKIVFTNNVIYVRLTIYVCSGWKLYAIEMIPAAGVLDTSLGKLDSGAKRHSVLRRLGNYGVEFAQLCFGNSIDRSAARSLRLYNKSHAVEYRRRAYYPPSVTPRL